MAIEVEGRHDTRERYVSTMVVDGRQDRVMKWLSRRSEVAMRPGRALILKKRSKHSWHVTCANHISN
jgi:hypothetical protein